MRVARNNRRLQQWKRAQARHERANGGMCLMLPGYRRVMLRIFWRRVVNSHEGVEMPEYL